MTTLHKKLLWTTTCLAALSIGTIPAAADVLTITVNTSGFNGSAAEIALDFIGGPSPANNITITNFLTDGSLGLQTPSGGASGTLPGTVTLDDGSNFFNEELAGVTLGNYFSFQVTTNLGPTTASFPDEFSLFLYDRSFNSLFSTSDPTGAHAIVTIDLTGGGTTSNSIYASAATFGAAPPTAVPEPASKLLLGSVFAMILLVQRRRAAGLWFQCRIAGRFAAVTAALLGSLSAQTNIATPVAADASVTVNLSGLRLDHTTNTYDSVVTVTNTSAQAISGPFYLAVTGIDAPTVTFSNSAGQLPNNLPYIPLSVGAQLAPNAPVVGGTLKFSNPQNVLFHVNTAVWDAASVTQIGGAHSALSCAGVVPGSVGTIQLTNTGPGPALYLPPVDNTGRPAICNPSPGAWLPLGDTLVACRTDGGTATPSSCAFNYPVTPEIAIYPNGAADLSITACKPIVPATPGLPPAGTASDGPIPIPIDYMPGCAFPPPGNATFLIVNNGPNTAYNALAAFGVPAGYTNYAVKFDTPARCTKATSLVMPNGQHYPGADVIDCFFQAIGVGQTITATVGVDLPSSNNTSAVPSLYAQVAVDSGENIDPVPTNDSIFFKPSFPVNRKVIWPTPPAPASCLKDPDDHTFAVLIDTCGVPSIVVDIVTSVILGGATAILGGTYALLRVGVLTPLDYIFNAAEVGSTIK